ncbi:Intradiol ring-cleavage dioxygenase [Dactylonectria macrodidyma]|uniref:Intradiol ring-cleavage dioxygenase n=1 Tax=Dactylonectria macrodidyma TaxID=307937 RepID=A0A9P9ID19_9HYPO|nr:Intradiol ring-cleavage dioxygenase [Dactylonectria macrodidyma]
MRFTNNAIAGLALLGRVAIAHPGHNIAEEAAERRDFLQSVKRTSLTHCADQLKARGIEARNIARRSAQVEKARKKRGLKKRDLDTVLATSHNETDQGYTVTQGPYYVAGEYVREDLVEEQEGLDIILDYQVIDVNTCEPVPDVYLEIWHCNSTGVYSGIVSSGNGDSSDETNIDNTWLRGIQLTDEDGVAQFESIFPGHYTSRATHIHVMVHTNATLLANQTLGSENYASHVGQVFFDQDLITEVELLAPYNTNTQDLTTNADDSILSEEVVTEGVDPVMEYTMLGDSLSDGLFAWLAFGINSTLSQAITPAAYLYADGGVAYENSGSGMDSGGDSTGTPSSGSAPTGTPSTNLPDTFNRA